MTQHRIPDPPPITDEMTTGALGADPSDLLGATVYTVYEIPDSDRGECLLLLASDRVLMLSTDPGYNDDASMSRNESRWEVLLYDATNTPAGEAIKRLKRGHWF